MDRRRTLLGATLVAIGTFAFGVVVILGDAAIAAGLPVPTALVVRFAMSAVILAALLLATRTPLKASAGEGRWLALLGAVIYAVEVSCFFIALGHGTAAAVTLLFYTYPVFVVLVALATKRARLSVRLVGALLCALVGVAIIIGPSSEVAIDPVGMAFTICSAMSFAAYVVLSERLIKETHPLTSAMWLCGWAVLGLTTFAVFDGDIELPQTPGTWLLVVGMGIGSAVAFVSFFAGLRMIGSVRTGIISAFEPFSAAILGAIFLAQPFTPSTLVGGAFIVAAAVLAVLSSPEMPVEAAGP